MRSRQDLSARADLISRIMEGGSRVKSHTGENVLLRGRRMSMGDRQDEMIGPSLHASFNLTSLSMAFGGEPRTSSYSHRHSVGHCNFTDTLARAIGTGVCTGLCKQAHPAGVITPLRVIDNVRARGREGGGKEGGGRQREREREQAKENKAKKREEEREMREQREEMRERRGSDPRVWRCFVNVDQMSG